MVNNGSSSPDLPTQFPLVDLHVSAKDLKDMDLLSKSDPICVLYIQREGKWQEFARTEVVNNDLNPEWVKIFRIMYVFEIRQPLLFRVYDVDCADEDLSHHDYIGEASIELSQIVCNEGGSTQLELTCKSKPGDKRGTLFITPEQVENSASVICGNFTGVELKKMHLLARNDPFFVIYKSTEGGRWLPILQSEVNKSMKWKRFIVPYQLLCNLDNDRPMRISFFDYRKHKTAVKIGHHDTTFARLGEAIGQALDITDEKGKCVGKFVVNELNIEQRFSFYDYLRGGVQLNLITAIDFTASNRDPRDPRSLHFLTEDGINQYETCIRSVGEVLCPYDNDQLFPVYGFGAKIMGKVEHCFPLTFNQQAPCVQGLDGILGAYKNALGQVQLSGPTLFSHIIRNATTLADQSWRNDRTYTLLLIITDGVINDMQDTIDAIVDAGRVPISIIIVGVGNADFSAMDRLDADEVPLVSRSGGKMVRDIVQFVPFNKFARLHYTALASEVLEEVPRQLCDWAKMHGIRPRGM